MPGCKKPFVAKGYCRMHYNRVYTKGTPHRETPRIEKIMKFVDEVALPCESDECLRHPFNVNDVGYCFINRGKRSARTSETLHRHICGRKHGAPPQPDYDAAHECGNAWCVNPRHLFWKTRADNMNDKRRHGTHIQGSKQWKASLTEEQVREIRELSKSMTQREIARRFGLGYKHVWHVLHDTWKHVDVDVVEKFRSTKLTDEQVREIRQIRNDTGMSYQAIGKIYGVSGGCVCLVCLRKIWKHVA
jgi:DNA-binding transcriptional regulator YiaG